MVKLRKFTQVLSNGVSVSRVPTGASFGSQSCTVIPVNTLVLHPTIPVACNNVAVGTLSLHPRTPKLCPYSGNLPHQAPPVCTPITRRWWSISSQVRGMAPPTPKPSRKQPDGSWLNKLHLIFWVFGVVILCYNVYHTYDPFVSESGGRQTKSKSLPAAAAAPARKRLAIIALCRESDAKEMAASMVSFDAAYNSRHRNDYIIFSENDWSPDAKALLRAATNSTVHFPILNSEQWGTPAFIDRGKFDNILKTKSFYGNTESYRRMCRFFAGPVFNTDILKGYEYAWRMDSHVRYLCDLGVGGDGSVDPIDQLLAANASYGYGMRMTELMYTVPTLWDTVKGYAKERGYMSHLQSAWGIGPDHGISKACHAWNNLEVTRLDFFRSPLYQDYFNHMDRSGGFFYERWGDAPVRTFALMLLQQPDQIVQFPGVGYQHPWWYTCPPSGQCAGVAGPRECKPDPAIQPQQFTDGRMCKFGE